jgi:hypothetical protein
MLSKDEKTMLKVIYLYPTVAPIDSLVEIADEISDHYSALQTLYENGFLVNEQAFERTYYKLPSLMKEFLSLMPPINSSNSWMIKISAWYSKFSMEIERKIYGRCSQKYLDILDKEYLNICASIKFCRRENIPQILVGFSYLYWYCFLRGKWSEFRLYSQSS